MRRIPVLLAGAVMGVAGIVAATVPPASAAASQASPASSISRAASTEAASVPVSTAQVSPDYTCPKKYLCVHFYDMVTGGYHWANYYDCKLYTFPPTWTATWYVNNQTTGTKAMFQYPGPPYAWDTPPAFSKGRPYGYPYDGKNGVKPTEVKPC